MSLLYTHEYKLTRKTQSLSSSLPRGDRDVKIFGQIVYNSMAQTHPYSIYVWCPSRSLQGKNHWAEPVRARTHHDALYVANLMHLESHAVIKVVRYGFTIVCFPDDHAVELVEMQIAREQAMPESPGAPWYVADER